MSEFEILDSINPMNHMDIVHSNEEALAILEQGDFSRALVILKQNAKMNPNHLTWNNLGLFYYEHGNEIKGARWVAAKKLGMHYMSKAANAAYHPINMMNLANCLFQLKEYTAAMQLYERITEPQYQLICQYNRGACLLALGEYRRAEDVFTALTNPADAEALQALGAASPEIPLAFSIAMQVWRGEKKRSASNSIDVPQLNLDLYDEIRLYFLLGEHRKVLELQDSFLQAWQPDEIICAMLLKSMEKVSGELASERQKALLDACPEACKFFSYSQRDKLLQNCTYIPPIIELCGYYGCKQHHTPLPF